MSVLHFACLTLNSTDLPFNSKWSRVWDPHPLLLCTSSFASPTEDGHNQLQPLLWLERDGWVAWLVVPGGVEATDRFLPHQQLPAEPDAKSCEQQSAGAETEAAAPPPIWGRNIMWMMIYRRRRAPMQEEAGLVSGRVLSD